MARRRLYGETQKRRKKKQTQTLKRQGSVTRVQATHQPAPFQKLGELSGQDVAFLEAMRDMGVRFFPRQGEAPVRQEKFRTVQFAAQQEDMANFMAAMERLGVTPLPARKPSARKTKPATTDKPSAQPVPEGDAAAAVSTESTTETALKGARKTQAGKSAALGRGTEFRMEEDGAELMEQLLREGTFDPAEKFAGAPAPPKKAPPPRQAPANREPDGELDLHGKTQEEAVHMVQNFLLTSYHRKLRDVLIITGKGLNSGQQGPVLQDAIYSWLERNGKRFAKSFSWAPPRHGGKGAIWVTLR
ncbi:MAG: Smr/MutS family protein [SAR324 cluster bacterium]|nr:Smr/MutS family protein [SAR324 cluster bacterium]